MIVNLNFKLGVLQNYLVEIRNTIKIVKKSKYNSTFHIVISLISTTNSIKKI